jgi:cell division protein FtsB
MDPTTITPLTSVLQYGFAGFSLVLVGVIVWLIRQLLAVLRANNRALASLTAALVKVTGDTGETRDEVRQLREELLKRTCMLSQQELQKLASRMCSPVPAT